MMRRALLAALVVAGAFPAGAAAALPARNVVVNPGAQEGASSSDYFAVNPPPGWSADAGVTQVYDADPAGAFFAGGDGGSSRSMAQVIDLSGAAAEIDTGNVVARLAARLGGFADQSDRAEVVATYRLAGGEAAATQRVPAVTRDDRDGQTVLIAREAPTGLVPVGTRSVEVRVNFVFVAGGGATYNDGYADDVSLSFSTVEDTAIDNPGAEIGPAVEDTNTVATPAAWLVTGNVTQHRYAGAGFPDAALSASIGGGEAFFSGGPANPQSRMQQEVRFDAATRAAIAAGTAGARISAHLGGYLTDEDRAEVVVTFVDEGPDNRTVGTLSIGPVTRTDRASLTTMLSRTASTAIPVATDFAIVEVIFTRQSGVQPTDYNDGYADNVALEVTAPPPDTAPPTTRIDTAGGAAGPVTVTVTADDGAGSGVAATRCALDPATAPARFADLPDENCPYLGGGGQVAAAGSHAIYAASRDVAGNDGTVVSQAFTIVEPDPTPDPTPDPPQQTTGLPAGSAPPVSKPDGPPIAPQAHFELTRVTNRFAPALLDATGSAGAIGYAWDLTGDGVTDVDCGNQPQLSLRPVALAQTVTLKVTGGDGRIDSQQRPVLPGGGAPSTASYAGVGYCTAPPGLGFEAADFTQNGGPPAGCNAVVSFGLVRATGCLVSKKAQALGGLQKQVVNAFTQEVKSEPGLSAYLGAAASAGAIQTGNVSAANLAWADAFDFFSSRTAVRINGLDFYPRNGSEITLIPALDQVLARDAIVKIGGATVRTGSVSLDVGAARGRVEIGDVELTGAIGDVAGFPFVPRTRIAFVAGGRAELPVYLKPGPTSRLTLADGAAPILTATLHADNERGLGTDAIDAIVPAPLRFGDWNLNPFAGPPAGVRFAYRRATSSWTALGALEVGTTAIRADVFGGLVFGPGRRNGGTLRAPLPLFTTELLPGVSVGDFDLRVSESDASGPATVQFGSQLRVQGSLVARPRSGDGGIAVRAATLRAEGEVLFPASGYRLGTAAVTATDAGPPGTYRIEGAGRRQLAGALTFEGSFTGHGHSRDGTLDITGGLSGNGIADGRVCYLDHCEPGWIAMNQSRIVACLTTSGLLVKAPVRADTFALPTDVCAGRGQTAKHVHEFLDPIGAGGHDPIKVGVGAIIGRAARSGQAPSGPYRLRVGRGARERRLVLFGENGSPSLRVTAPSGERVELPPGETVAGNAKTRLRRVPWAGATILTLTAPPPGDYTIEALDAAAITQFSGADLVRAPAPKATLHRDRLRYVLPKVKGLEATILDRGPGGDRVVRLTASGTGTIRLRRVADGRRHQLVARVRIDGLPQPRETVIASYRATPPRVAGVRAVRVVRRGARLTATWQRVTAARRYIVVVRERAGEARQQVVRRPRAVLRGITRWQAGTVTVRAMGTDRTMGPVRRARFRAQGRPANRFRPLSAFGKAA